MGKIIFAGLYNEENFGDPIIAKCTEAIYRKTHYDKFEAFHLDISCVDTHTLLQKHLDYKEN